MHITMSGTVESLRARDYDNHQSQLKAIKSSDKNRFVRFEERKDEGVLSQENFKNFSHGWWFSLLSLCVFLGDEGEENEQKSKSSD